LDRDTSGLLMFAKSEEIQEIIQRNWQENKVERI
jgi:23S rRNA pseudouridine1911/1915/1917 synthase